MHMQFRLRTVAGYGLVVTSSSSRFYQLGNDQWRGAISIGVYMVEWAVASRGGGERTRVPRLVDHYYQALFNGS